MRECAGSSIENDVVVKRLSRAGGGWDSGRVSVVFDLAASADCRATVIGSLSSASVDTVVTEQAGQEQMYSDRAAAVLTAAGRFATRVASLDDRLANRARRDPVAAASEAIGRSGPVADLAAETGLAVATEGFDTSEQALTAYTGPTISDARVGAAPPADATLRDQQTLRQRPSFGDTTRAVTNYRRSYRPREQRFDADTMETLSGRTSESRPLPPTAAVTRTVQRTRLPTMARRQPLSGQYWINSRAGSGFSKIFRRFSGCDVFATRPVSDTQLRVRCDGETMRRISA